MTEEEKQRVEQLISNLEVATGQVFARDSHLGDLVTKMLENLNGLRSLLGLVKRKG